jgi:hypothetical protein
MNKDIVATVMASLDLPSSKNLIKKKYSINTLLFFKKTQN